MRGSPVMILAIETEISGRRVPLPAVAGRNDEMYKLAAEGRGVIASENFALLHICTLGRHAGDSFSGWDFEIPVVGIIRDYSDQQGSLLMDRQFYTPALARRYCKRLSESIWIKEPTRPR